MLLTLKAKKKVHDPLCKPKLLVVRIFSFQICDVSCDEQKILSIGIAVLLVPAERNKIKDKSVI